MSDSDVAASDVARASDRVTLACRALSAAAKDLRVAHGRNSMMPVDDAACILEAETERVCELSEEIARLAANLIAWPGHAAEEPVKTTAHS